MKEPDLSAFFQSGSEVKDPLTQVLRAGACALITQALEAELQVLLNQHADRRLQDGRRAVVRNGYLPRRRVQTAVGEIEVRVPKVRDRSASGVSFVSRLLPPYFKPSVGAEELIPWLYLRGVCNGDFMELLVALLGHQARMLRGNVVSQLKARWLEEQDQWRSRILANQRYTCWWVNAVYSEDWTGDRQSLLVITGVTEQGEYKLVAVQSGDPESTLSWEALLDDLRERGLDSIPELAVGDGGLGFWKAIEKRHPNCRHQRCWDHKAAEVLGKLPEPMVPVLKRSLYQIWMANTRDEAHAIFDRTLARLSTQCTKCPLCAKAVRSLAGDREELLAFYDLPAEHWPNFRRPALFSQPSPDSSAMQRALAQHRSRPRTWLWPVAERR